ncbi:MAG: hypothetical protein AAGJ96_08620 [Pseudomonadota bacterium]
MSHAQTLGRSVEQILMHGCYITVGLDDGDRAAVAHHIEAFNGAVTALREGDDTTPPLRARGPLHVLTQMEPAWRDFSDFAVFATHGNFNRPYLSRMYELHAPVLESADRVTRRLAATYSTARIDVAASNTFANFAAMRREATRIAAYHCMLSLDVQAEAARVGLDTSLTAYAKRLELAFGGSTDAQVLTASVNGVAALRCLWRSFGSMEDALRPVAEGAVSPDFTEVADVRARMEYLVGLSDETVQLFEAELAGEAVAPSACSPLVG